MTTIMCSTLYHSGVQKRKKEKRKKVKRENHVVLGDISFLSLKEKKR